MHGAAQGMPHAYALLNLNQERSHVRNGQVAGSSLFTSTKSPGHRTEGGIPRKDAPFDVEPALVDDPMATSPSAGSTSLDGAVEREGHPSAERPNRPGVSTCDGVSLAIRRDGSTRLPCTRTRGSPEGVSLIDESALGNSRQGVESEKPRSAPECR
jgi:hypothetical protein